MLPFKRGALAGRLTSGVAGEHAGPEGRTQSRPRPAARHPRCRTRLPDYRPGTLGQSPPGRRPHPGPQAPRRPGRAAPQTAPRFGRTRELNKSWAAPGGSSHANDYARMVDMSQDALASALTLRGAPDPQALAAWIGRRRGAARSRSLANPDLGIYLAETTKDEQGNTLDAPNAGMSPPRGTSARRAHPCKPSRVTSAPRSRPPHMSARVPSRPSATAATRTPSPRTPATPSPWPRGR